MIPEAFWKNHKGGYFADVYTATADWNTQDVIGGIVPKMNGDKVVYKIQDGCVTETVKKNWKGNQRRTYPHNGIDYRGVWIVIDEFNRADIDKAFGQLFTSLRTKELKILTNFLEKTHQTIDIPNDFRIIGTLNTADKHYLFPLSNALKSRFAFIDIDIPGIEERDKEIFYALKEATRSLKDDFADKLVFDENNQRLDEKTDSELYSVIYQAYNFLSFVRLFRKLGTAILKIIYQNLLKSQNLGLDLKDILDNSINSTIIPQLEGLSEFSLGAIKAMQSNKVVEYFQEINNSNRRISAGDAFQKTMEFLGISEYAQFAQTRLDQNTWIKIQGTYDKKMKDRKEALPSNLSSTTRSLNDLASNAVI